MLSKLPNITTTIFSVMSRLAIEHNALNMAQGFPDFSCPQELNDLVYHYMNKGYNQYAPMPGLPALRKKVAEKNSSIYATDVDPEDVTITCGATQAIYTAITSVVKPGDEVIIFEPAFDSYVPSIELSGGIPVFITLSYPDFKPDWSQVKAAISERTRLIIINTPHNPTGAVFSTEDMKELSSIVKGTDILIISDEVYEHIIFDGHTHESALKYPALKNRSFVITSFGKTYHNTGWRMGYCIAPPELTHEFRKAHQFITFSIATPMQYAMADFLDRKEHYLGLPDFYQKKRDLFNSLIKNSRFEYVNSKGTYFQLLSYKKITDKGDIEFAKELTSKHGIASIPVSVFYKDKIDDKVLRFCFAKEEATIRKATEILCRI